MFHIKCTYPPPMLNKLDHLPSKPSFDQLLQQGIIIKPKITDTIGGDPVQNSKPEFYIVSHLLRPKLPNEDDWISLQ